MCKCTRAPLNNQLNEPYKQANNPNSDDESVKKNYIGNKNSVTLEQENATFIIKMILERTIQSQNNVDLCFI